MAIENQLNVNRIDGGAVAIGSNARAEINHFTEIIIRPDSFEDIPPAPGVQPYKGLTYFSEADADNFFGREKLSDHIVSRLHESHFLAVVGASGSGKSSLLRAGVVPRVRKLNWKTVVMTPTKRPLQRLANALTSEDKAISAADEIEASLADSSRTLHLAANKLAAGANSTHFLLVIDQFEELFTLCHDQTEREAFLGNLVTAVNEESAAVILIGMRADFYSHVAECGNLCKLVAQQQEYIGAMNQEDLVRIVAEPAKRGGWQFVEGFVEQILEDVGHEPGYLPLLSHALLETWQQRRGTVMTLGGYRAVGGVQSAISQTAEEMLQKLGEEKIPLVKHIFLELTELGVGAEDTRRIASLKDLAHTYENCGDVRDVLEKLTDARLIIIDGDQVQVAHEALIRRWPRLQTWIEEDRERLSFHRKISRAAQEWEDNDFCVDFLFRGTQLQKTELWIGENEPWQLTSDQLSFIEASQSNAEQAAEKEENLKATGRQHARLKDNFAIIGGAVGLGVAGLLINLANPEITGSFAIYYIVGAIIAGALVGFFYGPVFDLLVASARRHNVALSWSVGIVAGAAAFFLGAMLLFYLLSVALWSVLLVGCAWGIAAGAGRVWIKYKEQQNIFAASLVAALSGIVLAIVYTVLLQLGFVQLSMGVWLLLVIGILVPLTILFAENGAQSAGARRN